MINWLVRGLLVLAGFITSLFVAREELNFPIIQMVVAISLFTLVVIIIAFWSYFRKRLK